MNLTKSKSKLAALLGTTSLLTTLGALAAHAAEAMPQVAQAFPEEIPENVLVTGSLIRGTAAVGVPVTNLTPMDFATTGAVTTADLFRDYPGANVGQSSSATLGGGHTQRETRVNLRGLDQTGPRALMMVDGMRFPPQADGICAIDPSIIPQIALDHIDILADGASATYGSDAISGVINVILKRNYDGAQTQFGFSSASSGHLHYSASQLWGRTWDGGQITLSFEWYDDSAVYGTKHSNFTVDYRPWGFDDRRVLGGSIPGTISTGSPNLPFNADSGPNALGYIASATCTNCYAIPRASGANFDRSLNNGVGPLTAADNPNPLTWATLSSAAYHDPVAGGNGVQNVVDLNKLGWEEAPQQRIGEVMTVDQRLTKDISLFGEAFYSNRRGFLIDPAYQTPTNNVALSAIAVPTFNPYYPTGPGTPTNLRVSYDLGVERPALTNFHELSQRYALGLNVELPAEWRGQVYYSISSDASFTDAPGALNRNAVSAALGWTIKPLAGIGGAPGFGSWTRPTSVPYLNLFCDPYAFQCNSADTLNYFTGYRRVQERYSENEKGLKFDGPLFDLPGGTVKAAVGGTYIAAELTFNKLDGSGASNLMVSPILDFQPYNVWAGFTQLNVPIFGDNNAIPFFRRLEFELSWRHDQYNGTLHGGTSNPKVAMTWMLSEDAGFTLKGAWGTSFRFANAGEYSPVFSTAIAGFNTPTSFQIGGAPGVFHIACSNGTTPEPGSGAGKVFSSGLFNCGTTPFGIGLGGANTLLLRPYLAGTTTPVRQENFQLQPEQATNWSGGFELAPTKFLQGLDLQATYYIIKITNVLSAFQVQSETTFNRTAEGFHYIVPSDLAALDPACATANANPAACQPFETMVAGILNQNVNSSVQPAALTSIFFINDGGTVNQGSRKVDGIDFSASYDWDMGNIGAFNTGVTGTYYLHDIAITVPGSPPTDRYHQTIATAAATSQGVSVLPYFRYRARLGWSNGPWSVTGFVNHTSHYYHTLGSPPNVNASVCVAAGSSIVGGSSPCAIQNYNNLLTPWYSFDLSIGYDTGEDPANDYLKHVGINVVVRDIFDKHPEFQYVQPNAMRTGIAYDLLRDNEGRIVSLLLTKTW